MQQQTFRSYCTKISKKKIAKLQVKMMAFTYVAQNVIKRYYRKKNQPVLFSRQIILIRIYQKLYAGKYYNLEGSLKSDLF